MASGNLRFEVKVSECRGALRTLYGLSGPCDDCNRKNAEKWLVSFKKSDVCWMVSSHLLKNHVVCHHPAEMFFAAQSLVMFCRKSIIISIDHVTQVYSMIRYFVGERRLLTQLSLCLCALATVSQICCCKLKAKHQ